METETNNKQKTTGYDKGKQEWQQQTVMYDNIDQQ